MTQESHYTDEIGQKICTVIAQTDKGLDHLHNEYEWFPHPATIYRWVNEIPSFCEKYRAAKADQADYYAQQTMDIADAEPEYINSREGVRIDPAYVQLQKLRINTRQWHASKLAPKYKDRKDDNALTDELANKIIEKLLK